MLLILQQYATPHYAVLHYTTLHYTTLVHYTTLHYIIRTLTHTHTLTHVHTLTYTHSLTHAHITHTHSHTSHTRQAFQDGIVQFLICTDLAARGIDVKGLPYVINMTLPDETDTYFHRIGTTVTSCVCSCRCVCVCVRECVCMCVFVCVYIKAIHLSSTDSILMLIFQRKSLSFFFSFPYFCFILP